MVEPPTGTGNSRGKEGGWVHRVGSAAVERQEDGPPVGLAVALPRSLVPDRRVDGGGSGESIAAHCLQGCAGGAGWGQYVRVDARRAPQRRPGGCAPRLARESAQSESARRRNSERLWGQVVFHSVRTRWQKGGEVGCVKMMPVNEGRHRTANRQGANAPPPMTPPTHPGHPRAQTEYMEFSNAGWVPINSVGESRALYLARNSF